MMLCGLHPNFPVSTPHRLFVPLSALWLPAEFPELHTQEVWQAVKPQGERPGRSRDTSANPSASSCLLAVLL